MAFAFTPFAALATLGTQLTSALQEDLTSCGVTDKAQEAILRALESDDISEAMRGNLGIRYLSSISGQNNLHQRLKTEVGEKSGAFEESMKAFDWIMTILDDVHRLTRGRTTISDKEYRKLVESLIKKTDTEEEG